ncbi:S8 family peptidase [Scytonema sp. UIC 10036]|uniref:S8 family peptidase n=1 Tax=Scytonema sp. UIC 10036 TaxID=2304196 RepID=UPI0012DA666C|nr:S8 family peptidase [Scytonema sp. UIC 10036]
MSSKLEPQLWFLINKSKQDGAKVAYSIIAKRVGLTQTEGKPSTVEVLVRCVDSNRVEDLRNLGIHIHYAVQKPYTVVSGKVTLDTLKRLSESEFVDRVEASSPYEKQLDLSLQAIDVISVHQDNPPLKGRGVIIGIIDTGIDYTHDSFRNRDGTSRILYLWNQKAGQDTQNRVPYGREYIQDELNAALSTSNPSSVVNCLDEDGHGTHVAGIATANDYGSQSTYIGVAPEADLIVVALQFDGGDFGNSTKVFDAFNYIILRAKMERKPVSINLSLGELIKRRAGETILERSLNQVFLREPNVVVVCAAGNEQEKCLHAGGQMAQGTTKTLKFEISENQSYAFIYVCYDDLDRMSVALQPPSGNSLGFVTPTEEYEYFQTLANNYVVIKYESKGGDVLAAIVLSSPNSASYLESGTWTLEIRGDNIQVGGYHVWIDGDEQLRFLPSCADETCTVVIPGTAKRVITVGSYVTRPDPRHPDSRPGDISSFSSRGPTHYGLQKPEIVAPGENIVSTRSSSPLSRLSCPAYHHYLKHTLMKGTSMASPHVTGAAALILSIRNDLTCEQVKQILIATAQRNESTSNTPDDTWGYGKLNIKAAVEFARTAQFPEISHTEVRGTEFSWQTNIPTTNVVRFHSHLDKLQIGKVLGEQIGNAEPQTQHQLTLNGLTPGTYYCEIQATSEGNLWTIDDNGGQFYIVEIVE